MRKVFTASFWISLSIVSNLSSCFIDSSVSNKEQLSSTILWDVLGVVIEKLISGFVDCGGVYSFAAILASSSSFCFRC